MTSRPIPFTPGEYYHLYNRGNNRNIVFFERANYLFFLYRLQQSLLPTADVVAYCLMPTHYHLLIRLKQEGLSRGMQRFANSYTKAINTKYDRVGALFQGAFKAKHIRKSSYLLRLSSYIHLNPVVGGLTATPEDWEFSSYRDYVGLRDGTWIESGIILSQFGSQVEYRMFVEKEKITGTEDISELLLD